MQGQQAAAVADALTQDAPVSASGHQVMHCDQLAAGAIDELAANYQLTAIKVDAGDAIPGSYWGAPEAGLISDRLFWRADTPLHSLLHELAHWVCIAPARRTALDTDAGGDDDEECAVCYLEVLLADHWQSFGAARCLADMDAWGYSFREGSATAWFEGDGREARAWLLGHRLIQADGTPTWRLRT